MALYGCMIPSMRNVCGHSWLAMATCVAQSQVESMLCCWAKPATLYALQQPGLHGTCVLLQSDAPRLYENNTCL